MTKIRLKCSMATLAVALAAAFAAPQVAAQAKEPLRIGIPTTMSGPYGAIGRQVQRAAEFAAAEVNAKGGVDGHRVELRMLDTETKPDVARKQAEKLALEGFNVLTGAISSGEILAIGPMLERWDAIFVNTMAKSAKITGDSCATRLFRVNQADAHDIAAINPWLKTRKEKKWVVMGFDTAWGREISKNFKEAALADGRQILAEYYPPFGTNDYAPYIQQMKGLNPDGVFVSLTGRDAINFLNLSKQFGLADTVTTAGVSIALDMHIEAVGAVAKGIWGNVNYGATIDNPDNKRFVAAWRKFYNGADPGDLEGENYVAYQTIFQAVEKAHSVKPIDIARALHGGTFETVLGRAQIRAADHQMVLPNYFGQVGEVGGKLVKIVSLTVSPELATPAPDGTCKMGKL